ncbi:hypothetical protein TNCV_362631 [Trichonephila clavipes]|nr:hypothetical protein TNCV_362631 [Trichonephila clavipes]
MTASSRTRIKQPYIDRPRATDIPFHPQTEIRCTKEKWLELLHDSNPWKSSHRRALIASRALGAPGGCHPFNAPLGVLVSWRILPTCKPPPQGIPNIFNGV